MTRSTIMTAALLALGAGGSLAQTPPALQCYREARAEMGQCIDQAKTVCEATYQGAFIQCFQPDPSCATGCQDRETECEAGPRARQSECQQVCDNAAKNASQTCRNRPDPAGCNIRVRLRKLKCDQRCVRGAAPALQRCNQLFNACLIRCAGG
jgi:hypothetical protein